jgi:DNA-binding NarL/FixJ family response regulator
MLDAPGEFFFYTGIRKEEGRMVKHILIADDQPKVRLALRLLLEQEQGLIVVAEADDAEGLLAQAEAICPDLVLLDWSLQAAAAVDLLPALRSLCPNLAVIVLSGQPGIEEYALEAGADGFVSKADPPEQLLTAIRSTG